MVVIFLHSRFLRNQLLSEAEIWNWAAGGGVREVQTMMLIVDNHCPTDILQLQEHYDRENSTTIAVCVKYTTTDSSRSWADNEFPATTQLLSRTIFLNNNYFFSIWSWKRSISGVHVFFIFLWGRVGQFSLFGCQEEDGGFQQEEAGSTFWLFKKLLYYDTLLCMLFFFPEFYLVCSAKE